MTPAVVVVVDIVFVTVVVVVVVDFVFVTVVVVAVGVVFVTVVSVKVDVVFFTVVVIIFVAAAVASSAGGFDLFELEWNVLCCNCLENKKNNNKKTTI